MGTTYGLNPIPKEGASRFTIKIQKIGDFQDFEVGFLAPGAKLDYHQGENKKAFFYCIWPDQMDGQMMIAGQEADKGLYTPKEND